jgi:paraquat-inducible protein A
MMTTASLLGSQEDTIMSGVIFLWQSGSWPLAAVVFFASVMVPLLKIIALVYLTPRPSGARVNPLQRTRLYRMVEFVGRWSMLDIYVITILVALVSSRGSPPSRPARAPWPSAPWWC